MPMGTTQSPPLLDGVSPYELSCPSNAFPLRQDRAESGKMKPHTT